MAQCPPPPPSPAPSIGSDGHSGLLNLPQEDLYNQLGQIIRVQARTAEQLDQLVRLVARGHEHLSQRMLLVESILSHRATGSSQVTTTPAKAPPLRSRSLTRR